MKRMITMLALSATMVLATASVALADPPANAGSPTCAGVDTGTAQVPHVLVNHGDHITGDYVAIQGNAGGGRPAHFGPHVVSAGASFCLAQAQAPELLGTPGRFAD